MPSVKLTECLPFWKTAPAGMEWSASPIRSPHWRSRAGSGLAASVALHSLSRGCGVRAALTHRNECSHEAQALLRRAPGADQGEAMGGERAAATKIKHVSGDRAWLPYLVTVKTVFCLLWRSGHNSTLSGSMRLTLPSPGWWEICFLKQSCGEFSCFPKPPIVTGDGDEETMVPFSKTHRGWPFPLRKGTLAPTHEWTKFQNGEQGVSGSKMQAVEMRIEIILLNIVGEKYCLLRHHPSMEWR